MRCSRPASAALRCSPVNCGALHAWAAVCLLPSQKATRPLKKSSTFPFGRPKTCGQRGLPGVPKAATDKLTAELAHELARVRVARGFYSNPGLWFGTRKSDGSGPRLAGPQQIRIAPISSAAPIAALSPPIRSFDDPHRKKLARHVPARWPKIRLHDNRGKTVNGR